MVVLALAFSLAAVVLLAFGLIGSAGVAAVVLALVAAIGAWVWLLLALRPAAP